MKYFEKIFCEIIVFPFPKNYPYVLRKVVSGENADKRRNENQVNIGFIS